MSDFSFEIEVVVFSEYRVSAIVQDGVVLSICAEAAFISNVREVRGAWMSANFAKFQQCFPVHFLSHAKYQVGAEDFVSCYGCVLGDEALEFCVSRDGGCHLRIEGLPLINMQMAKDVAESILFASEYIG
ncbi:MAG: hypothetical protein Q8S01_05645 [Ignavibacteria bacterium]|nr:hypothetical protein [Ignavibacteria bacterium]